MLKSRAHSDLDKLVEALFFIAAAALLRSRSAAHCALAGRRIAGASFGTLTGRRLGRLVGGAGSGCLAPFSPAAASWRRSGWCLRRGLLLQRSLVELISLADSPPAGLVRTKPRCILQAHDVAAL